MNLSSTIFGLFALLGLSSARPPNILFFLIDDWGSADIGYSGFDIQTPHMDRYAREGVTLTNYYTQQICTPTRAAFLTGRYPMRVGLQHYVLSGPRPFGLPLEEKLLSNYLQDVGYSTHLVGKWHLGFHSWGHTPVFRGFDSFYGFYNGAIDYYTHDYQGFLDLFLGRCPEYGPTFIHSSTLFINKAKEIASNHSAQNPDQPLFLYYAHQNVHTPLQPLQEYVNRCRHIEDPARRLYCGLVLQVDDTVHEMVEHFKELGLWENTLLIVSGDNGGLPEDGGYNFPYRARKGDLFDGGVRANGFVAGPVLPPQAAGSEYGGMMHVMDWFNTLMHVAGTEPDQPGPIIDGLDQWQYLIGEIPGSPRNELLLNSDEMPTQPWEIFNASGHGLIINDYKLLVNVQVRPVIPIPGYEHLDIPKMPSGTKTGKEEDRYTFLFNIKEDPYETTNIMHDEPEIYQSMLARLNQFRSQAVPPLNQPDDPIAIEIAQLSNYTWTPWIPDGNSQPIC